MDRYSQGVIVRPGRHYVNALIVSNATIGVVWADKDISSYIGKKRVLALIRVLEKGLGQESLAMRTKGVTSSTHLGFGSIGSGYMELGETSDVLVETNETGVFQWKTLANLPVDAWLIAYFD